eukprot:TRINITY_DN2735_c0_g1_i1.p1 TRINITY_DN2735_c0_g1~~TRINITY_DN2735_c0_g1_i1.p1  ORF type:complete len:1156 (+),score=290.36 TRINITY_DN2735_c0_g1_i1:85-3468(+)
MDITRNQYFEDNGTYLNDAIMDEYGINTNNPTTGMAHGHIHGHTQNHQSRLVYNNSSRSTIGVGINNNLLHKFNTKVNSKETYVFELFKWLKSIEEEEDTVSTRCIYPFYDLIHNYSWTQLIPQGFIATFAQFKFKTQYPQLREKGQLFTQIHLLGLLTSPFDPDPYLRFSSYLLDTVNTQYNCVSSVVNENDKYWNGNRGTGDNLKTNMKINGNHGNHGKSQIKLLNSMSQAHQERHNAFSSLYVLSFDAQCVINDDLEILDFNSAFPETFRISNDDQNRRLTFKDFCVNCKSCDFCLNQDDEIHKFEHDISEFQNKVAQTKVLGMHEFNFIFKKSDDVVFLANVAIISLVDKLPIYMSFDTANSNVNNDHFQQHGMHNNNKQATHTIGLPSISQSTAGHRYSSVAKRYKGNSFKSKSGPKFQLVIRDMTELRKSESHLKQVSKLYLSLWDSLQTPLFLCLESGVITYSNSAFSKLVQLTANSIIGKHVHEFFPSKSTKDNFIREHILNKTWRVTELMVVDTTAQTQGQKNNGDNSSENVNRQFKVEISIGSLELSHKAYYLALLTNIEEITVSPHLVGFKEKVEKFLKYCRKPSLVFKCEMENIGKSSYFSNIGANIEFIDMLTVFSNQKLLEYFTLTNFFYEIKNQTQEALNVDLNLCQYERDIWFLMIQQLAGKHFLTKVSMKDEVSPAIILISKLPFGSNIYLLEVSSAREFANISFVDASKYILSVLFNSLELLKDKFDLNIVSSNIIRHVGSLLSITSTPSTIAMRSAKENFFYHAGSKLSHNVLNLNPSKVSLVDTDGSEISSLFPSDHSIASSSISSLDQITNSYRSNSSSIPIENSSSGNLNKDSYIPSFLDQDDPKSGQHNKFTINGGSRRKKEIHPTLTINIESELQSRLKDVGLTSVPSTFVSYSQIKQEQNKLGVLNDSLSSQSSPISPNSQRNLDLLETTALDQIDIDGDIDEKKDFLSDTEFEVSLIKNDSFSEENNFSSSQFSVSLIDSDINEETDTTPSDFSLFEKTVVPMVITKIDDDNNVDDVFLDPFTRNKTIKKSSSIEIDLAAQLNEMLLASELIDKPRVSPFYVSPLEMSRTESEINESSQKISTFHSEYVSENSTSEEEKES